MAKDSGSDVTDQLMDLSQFPLVKQGDSDDSLPSSENSTQECIDRMAFQMLQDAEKDTGTFSPPNQQNSRKRKRSLDLSHNSVTLLPSQSFRNQQNHFISQIVPLSHIQQQKNGNIDTQIEALELRLTQMREQNQLFWIMLSQQKVTLQSLSRMMGVPLTSNVYMGDLPQLPHCMWEHLRHIPQNVAVFVVNHNLQFLATNSAFRQMVQCGEEDFCTSRLTSWHFEQTNLPFEVSRHNMSCAIHSGAMHITCTTMWKTKYNKEIIVFHDAHIVHATPMPFCYVIVHVVESFDARVQFDSDIVMVNEGLQETNKKLDVKLSPPALMDVLLKRLFQKRLSMVRHVDQQMRTS